MEVFFDYIWAMVPETWYGLIAMVVTIATAITMFMSSKSDNPYISKLLGLLNFVAGNIAKNKNADAE